MAVEHRGNWAFAVATVLSIGIFVAPVVALLVAAARVTPAAPT